MVHALLEQSDVALRLPAWLETPPEDASILPDPYDDTYTLAMSGSGDASPQRIDLTREEFIALKHELALIRGVLVQVSPEMDEVLGSAGGRDQTRRQ